LPDIGSYLGTALLLSQSDRASRRRS
jgi:hypothetical protein